MKNTCKTDKRFNLFLAPSDEEGGQAKARLRVFHTQPLATRIPSVFWHLTTPKSTHYGGGPLNEGGETVAADLRLRCRGGSLRPPAGASKIGANGPSRTTVPTQQLKIGRVGTTVPGGPHRQHPKTINGIRKQACLRMPFILYTFKTPFFGRCNRRGIRS